MSLTAVIERSHRDKEAWRYTDLDKLLGAAPATRKTGKAAKLPPLPSIIAEPSLRHQIVFVNGVWHKELSRLGELPPGVIESAAGDAYNLTLEKQTCLITTPIELVFLTQGENAHAPEARLNITIGPNARLTIIEHHAGSASAGAHVIETAVHLGAQSKLVHGKILHGPGNAAHLARTETHVSEGAYYRNFALLKNARLVRNEIGVTLEGKLAQCSLNGLMLLRGAEHIDTHTHITHASPHGTSRQLYKSVVKDSAHGVFQGKISVAKDAQKTDGQQLSRALLLSDQAEMDAKPELEILADDVTCSHGCAVGDLDQDALFYLRSRGLDEAAARALLLRGFIDEVIDTMDVAEWRDYARAEAGRWLDE